MIVVLKMDGNGKVVQVVRENTFLQPLKHNLGMKCENIYYHGANLKNGYFFFFFKFWMNDQYYPQNFTTANQ